MDPALFLAVARGDRPSLEAIFPRPPPAAALAPPADQAARLRRLQALTAEGDGVLHVAARFGHHNLVTDLCQLATEAIPEDQRQWRLANFLRARNEKGETCLHEAVRCGRAGVVQALVLIDDTLMDDNRLRPLVQVVDDEAVSPLYLATTLRRADIVRIILNVERVHAASYDGPQGRTALHAAVVVNSTDIVNQLLVWNNADRDLITRTDASGSTPLHYLASSLSANTIAESFLPIGARQANERAAHCADIKGSLPIHVAAGHGRLDIIELLLCDVCHICMQTRNSSGQTFLHVAVQKERSDVVAYVCSQVDDRLLLTTILNARDRDGNTALHLAVLTGNQVDFCSLLRRREVDLNIANMDGHTPLDLVFLSGKVDTEITGIEGYIIPQMHFLTGERSFRYIQNSHDWMVYDLVVAGGRRGVHRWDDFVTRFPPKQDTEKKWEKVGKSAGVLAVCATLILNATLVLPFNVAARCQPQQLPPPTPSTPSSWRRAFPFIAFLACDAVAFVSSAVATFCCTYAGFATAENGSRLSHLYFGAGCLAAASLAIIAAFASGIFLAFGTGLLIIPTVVLLLFVVGRYSGIRAPFESAKLHDGALRHRLGTEAFHRSLYVENTRMRRRFCRRHRPFLLAAAVFVMYCFVVFTSMFSDVRR